MQVMGTDLLSMPTMSEPAMKSSLLKGRSSSERREMKQMLMK